MTRRIMLIGATGAFGSRLAAMLARLSGITLIVTSRSKNKARALAQRLGTSANCRIEGEVFHHGGGVEARLRRLRPWLVIDASGPFQNANYDTPRAALAEGAHWIDLADAAEYILGFDQALDEIARQQGLTAVTGASSTPALSFAATQGITGGWHRIDDVEIGIYPAGGSDVGRAVVEAVLSYAGAEVPVCECGLPRMVTGWGRAERVMIAGLGERYRSAVATADYALLPRHLGARAVRFYAGLESRVEHLGLVGLAKLRNRGVIGSAVRLAPLLHQARVVTRSFCGSTGAMIVTARGVDGSGSPAVGEWSLIAGNGDGPNVPVLPALALTKRLLQQHAVPGASCSAGVLPLECIEAEFAPFSIRTSKVPVRQVGPLAA